MAVGSGRRCDVVVVGGGLAGIHAASLLRHHGVDAVVLEVCRRFGGRALSVEVEGAHFDLGAAWCGANHLRLRRIIEGAGIATFPQRCEGTKVIEHGGRASIVDALPLSDALGAVRSALLLRKLDRMAARVPLEVPYQAYKAGEWDRQSVDEMARRFLGTGRARAQFDAAIRVLFGTEPSQLSLLYLLFFLNSAGGFRRLMSEDGARHERVVTGMQSLIDALAERLGDNVVLDAAVTAIAQDDDEVLVTSRAGTFAGRYAVVAVPPPLTLAIDFEPALPAARRMIVERWPMGAMVTVLAFFEEASWRRKGLSGQAVSTRGPLSRVHDASSHDGRVGCLGGVVVAGEARRWAHKSDSERRRLVLEQLQRLFGVSPDQCTRLIEQDWATERWTGGGPLAAMPPRVLTEHAGSWRERVGRILWAGCEYARHYNGQLEGALESAERSGSEVAHLL